MITIDTQEIDPADDVSLTTAQLATGVLGDGPLEITVYSYPDTRDGAFVAVDGAESTALTLRPSSARHLARELLRAAQWAEDIDRALDGGR